MKLLVKLTHIVVHTVEFGLLRCDLSLDGLDLDRGVLRSGILLCELRGSVIAAQPLRSINLRHVFTTQAYPWTSSVWWGLPGDVHLVDITCHILPGGGSALATQRHLDFSELSSEVVILPLGFSCGALLRLDP